MNDKNIIFRTRDDEVKAIILHNQECAKRILEKAGIEQSHPNYKEYFALTASNVNQTGRFGTYNESVEDMFVEMLKSDEMSLLQYREASKLYRKEIIERQQLGASGSTFSGRDESYENLKANIDETIKSGVEMRGEFETDFPKEFYDENGKLRSRIVVDIPLEMQENSALGMIGSYASNHNEISFDRENNVIIDNGKKVGPEKFFKGKKEILDDKFLKKIGADETLLDMTDTELFDILREGNYQKFLELRKKRGMAKDKRNEALRTALADRHIFKDVSSRMDIIGDKESLLHQIKDLALDFEAKAKLVRSEAEKETLEVIDRVMFSVSPYDVATQSTFKDWKSCMNAVGCNHKYVDDAIGMGSIVAYGYDSKNPQKMVSRLLIHPYTNEAGDVAYKVNPRVYGHENMAFRKLVKDVVKDNFNDGKEGVFVFNRNKGNGDRGGLYNDGGVDNLIIMKPDENGVLDLRKYLDYDKNCDLNDLNFSGVKKIKVPDGTKLSNLCLPKGVEIEFEGDVWLCGKIDGNLDFRNEEKVILSNCVSVGENVKLPKTVKIKDVFPEGINFDEIDKVELDRVEKIPDGVKLSKEVVLSGIVEKGNFEGVEKFRLGEYVRIGKDVKLPENIDWSKVSVLGGYIPKGCDLSKNKAVTFENVFEVGEGLKLPKRVEISGNIWKDMDFSEVEDFQVDDNDLYIAAKDKRSKKVAINGEIPDGVDLSDLDSLKFSGEVKIGKGVKLPQNIDWSDVYSVSGYIPDGLEIKGVDEVRLVDEVIFGKDVKMPKITLGHDFTSRVAISGYIPDKMEFRGGATKVDLVDDVFLGKDVKLGYHLDVSKAKIKGDVVFQDQLKDVDFSEANSLKFGMGDDFSKDIKLPRNGNVSFDEAIVVKDAKSVEKLAELQCKSLVIFNGDLTEDMKVAPDMILMVEKKDDVSIVYPQGKEKEAKERVFKLLNGPNAEFDEDELKDLEEKIKFVSREQFKEQKGIKFIDNRDVGDLNREMNTVASESLVDSQSKLEKRIDGRNEAKVVAEERRVLRESLKESVSDGVIKKGGIDVPYFGSMEEFRDWARGLDRKEVRSWTSKDWLKMYDRVDDFVKNNEGFDKLFREKLPDFAKEHNWNITDEMLKNPDTEFALKRCFFIDKEGGDGIGILNRNFAFEEKDFDLIRKMGKRLDVIMRMLRALKHLWS